MRWPLPSAAWCAQMDCLSHFACACACVLNRDEEPYMPAHAQAVQAVVKRGLAQTS